MKIICYRNIYLFTVLSKQYLSWVNYFILASKENKKQNKSCVEKYTGEPLVYTNDSIIQILQSVQEEKVLHKCPQFTFFQDEEYVNIVVETPNLFPKAFW